MLILKRPATSIILSKRHLFAFGLAVVLFGAIAEDVRAQVYPNPGVGGGRRYQMGQDIFNKAREAFQMGDYMSCIELCKRAKNFAAGDKKIIHLLALAYAEAGDNYNANLEFMQATTLDYNFIEARNNYARFLMKTGKKKDAERELEKCIKINPNYPDAHYNLGVLRREQGDLDNAVEEFRTAIRLRPNYFAAQRELGITLYEQYNNGRIKDIRGSVEKLQTAARLVPKNPLVHHYLANVWCAEGNLDEAEKEYRLSLRNDPSVAISHFELAKLRFLRGDPDRCLRELNRAFKVNPRYTESKGYPGIDTKKMRVFSAKSNELKGRFEKAAGDWRDVAHQDRRPDKYTKKIKELFRDAKRQEKRRKKDVTYDPAEVQALIDRGIDLVDEGNFPEAKRAFNRVIELNPESFEGYQNLGSLYEFEGNYDRAMGYYKKALAIEPEYSGLHYNMGYVLEKMGLPMEAGRSYQKYYDIEGKYPYDPKHIVNLRLMDERQKARDKFNKNYQSGF